MIVFVASLTTSAWAQQDAALCKGGFSEQDQAFLKALKIAVDE